MENEEENFEIHENIESDHEEDKKEDIEGEMILNLSNSAKYPSVNKNGQSANGGGSVVARMSSALLARAYIPGPVQMKECMHFLDFGIKVEILLYEIASIMYWVSLGEIGLFIFGIFIFFTQAS
eukprot:CAMPEP_0176374936 /NCGR_PEP_ID=MMETSP0126-20121128/27138_1 /TAXON_ID=141414 ORGANISM="Strombidinopsis acuminatum, Strain SPMC142" /NCGR_SAMPLE_ID=MMETSP0126 /ASSEMBLY_ACC=CAM_ASM_000229 /LENGTH=123 /DNA_ID=CAMNT_0017735775 /DNA_START=41 /DNA_END=412 /DNA_ORIENTATION=-